MMVAAPDPKQRTYEARIWRLAFMLTGSAAAAASVVTRVAHGKHKLTALEPTHLDRLVILRAREYEASSAHASIDALAALAARAWRTLRAEGATQQRETKASIALGSEAAALLSRVVEMDCQPREAWVLARLDEVGEMWMARAMDCSRTAAAMHLAAADRHMGKMFDDDAARLAEAIALLRGELDRLDPMPIIDEPRIARRHLWRTIAAAAAVVALIVAALVLAQS
jgi:hypothetical protein